MSIELEDALDDFGALTYTFDSKGRLTMRPTLYAGRVGANTKPTPVIYGSHAGYSLPIYNADNEDLYFRDYIPGRWDGASNITCTAICSLATTQSGGVTKDFKLQLDWENVPDGGTLTASPHSLTANVTCAVNEAQYVQHYVTFTIPYATYSPNITQSDHLGYRLFRIVADGTAITGEVIVEDILLTYQVNRIYKAIPTTTSTTTSA